MHTSEETESYKNKDIIKFIKQQRALDKNLPTNLNSNILDKLRHNYMNIDILNKAQKPMTLNTSDNQSKYIIFYLKLGLLRAISKNSTDSTYKVQLSKLGYQLLKSLPIQKDIEKYHKYEKSSDTIFVSAFLLGILVIFVGSLFLEIVNAFNHFSLILVSSLSAMFIGAIRSDYLDDKADDYKKHYSLTYYQILNFLKSHVNSHTYNIDLRIILNSLNNH